MALPTAKNVTSESQLAGPLGQLAQLTTQFNLLVDQMRVLCLKLDADAVNTALNDTNYTALVTDAATSAAKINVVQ